MHDLASLAIFIRTSAGDKQHTGALAPGLKQRVGASQTTVPDLDSQVEYVCVCVRVGGVKTCAEK